MNSVWSYDFVFDACANGQQIKCLTVVDEFTRESLAIDVSTSIRSKRVITKAQTEQSAAERAENEAKNARDTEAARALEAAQRIFSDFVTPQFADAADAFTKAGLKAEHGSSHFADPSNGLGRWLTVQGTDGSVSRLEFIWGRGKPQILRIESSKMDSAKRPLDLGVKTEAPLERFTQNETQTRLAQLIRLVYPKSQ